MQVSLPWPSADLSPNARSRTWHKGHRARAAYKRLCGSECIAQGVRKVTADRLSVTLTFHPPVKRNHDADNLIARMKAGLDALSAALGVDDSRFDLGAPVIGEPRGPHGIVLVQIELAA